jgi:competence protein ComEC
VRVLVEAVMSEFTAARHVHQARTPVLLFATVDDLETLRIGSSFRVRGTLAATAPGEAHEFLLFARGDLEPTGGPPPWLAWADPMRAAFRASASGLPGDGSALLTGLAIGDDREVDDELTEAMTVSGLTHLTAVSGANCAIVVGAVVLIGGAAGLGRRARILVALGVLGLFVVLVTPEPSVLRASAMAVAVLVATALGRPGAGLPPLCLSVIVLLVADPWLSRSAGFALSVLATAGLLLLTRPIAAAAGRYLPRAPALAVAVPLAAQLACQPVLFLIAPQLTPYTLVANLLAEPAAALVSVLGLAVCLLAIVSPRLAELAVWLPWVPSAWIGAVARFFAGLPFAVISVTDSAVAAAGAAGLLALTFFWITAGRRHRRLSRGTAALAAAALLIGAGCATGSVIARDTALPRDWMLAACDIGQGDAVLVRDPVSAAVALIDVGPDPEPLQLCLDRLHLDRIDLLVLTHYDLDHVGGLDAVVGRADTALVGPPDGASDEQLISRLEGGGTRLVDAARGLNGTLGTLRWSVLWPKPGTRLRGNDASITLRFSGALRMLFLGDLGEQAQDAVLAAGPIGAVDLVKVAHHGSADQSEELYSEASATLGIVSVGADDDYGHPTPALIAILARTGTQLFRTDRMGLITVSVRGGETVVWTDERAPP